MNLLELPLVLVLGLIMFVFSIILHEIAHGWVADRLGDPTARMAGRLTLNPLPHIDPVMTIIFPLLLILSGSAVIFGGAKPVPIDPYNLRQGRKDMGLIGLAGPVTNILIGVFLLLMVRLLTLVLPSAILSTSPLPSVFGAFLFVALYNFLLAALNLIPIPPLDGSRILAAILPERFAVVLDRIEPFGMFILLFLLLFPMGGFSLGNFVFGIANHWMDLITKLF